ncbi:YraN family protein [Paenirhodobacter sp.]|jgi:putative endonuclease|uniref:YraN family protein n=1 Tax=Paenirhodobacter sp. TaxID=1965326 RepID=UPI003B514353
MSGAMSFHAGLSAEGQVAALYQREGSGIAAHRWRGQYGGEIDLIARDGDTLIFIEVKKSRSCAEAAARVSERQMRRIWISAEEFLTSVPEAANLNMRFDVALVDGQGQIQILQNAYCFF